MPFPEEFESRLNQFFPDYADVILRSLKSKKESVSFRVNLIKSDRIDVLRELKQNGFKVKDVLWNKDAFVLIDKTLRELQQLDIYKQGKIYVQNLSSMMPVMFMELEEGQKILDLCAAPGSKTSQIGSLLRNECELVAVEKIKPRFFKLKANLELQGVNANALLMDGSKVGRIFPEYFDRILLDVPCSAEGRFELNNPRTYKYWSLRKVKEMQRKQKRLIASAYYALKPGGRIVYSTCTFSPEENEFLVKWAMNKFGDLKEVSISIPVKNSFRGIEKIGWHIIPDYAMEGFFICVIEKDKR